MVGHEGFTISMIIKCNTRYESATREGEIKMVSCTTFQGFIWNPVGGRGWSMDHPFNTFSLSSSYFILVFNLLQMLQVKGLYYIIFCFFGVLWNVGALDSHFMILMMKESCERGRGYFLVSVLGRFSRAFYLHSAPFFSSFLPPSAPFFPWNLFFIKLFAGPPPFLCVNYSDADVMGLLLLVLNDAADEERKMVSASAHQDHQLIRISSSAEIISCFDNSYDS